MIFGRTQNTSTGKKRFLDLISQARKQHIVNNSTPLRSLENFCWSLVRCLYKVCRCFCLQRGQRATLRAREIAYCVKSNTQLLMQFYREVMCLKVNCILFFNCSSSTSIKVIFLRTLARSVRITCNDIRVCSVLLLRVVIVLCHDLLKKTRKLSTSTTKKSFLLVLAHSPPKLAGT